MSNTLRMHILLLLLSYALILENRVWREEKKKNDDDEINGHAIIGVRFEMPKLIYLKVRYVIWKAHEKKKKKHVGH